MQLTKPTARIFLPTGILAHESETGRLEKVTHLGIGAHQDDLEIMASHGITQCFSKAEAWFGGVTCTDGRGSPRAGLYGNYSDAEMGEIRIQEQERAAQLGAYAVMAQLGYSSAETRAWPNPGLLADLRQLFARCRPRYVYTHNLMDKHPTHVAVALTVIEALRQEKLSPLAVYGCEVWRDLDWLADEAKVPLDLTGHEGLVAKLIQCFDSQIAGGKNYDSATLGRMHANATYFTSNAVNKCDSLWFAIDLTPLVVNPDLAVIDFVRSHLQKFSEDVETRLKPLVI